MNGYTIDLIASLLLHCDSTTRRYFYSKKKTFLFSLVYMWPACMSQNLILDGLICLQDFS